MPPPVKAPPRQRTTVNNLRRAAPGRRLSAERMVAGNVALVHWAVRRVCHIDDAHPDYEEAVAEGTVALWRASLEWDGMRGVAFSTYAVKSLQNALSEWSQTEWRYGMKRGVPKGQRVARPTGLTHDDEFFASLARGDGADVGAACVLDEEVSAMMAALDQIPARYARAVRGRFLDGLTYEQMAKRDGNSKQLMQQRVLCGLAALRHVLMPEKAPIKKIGNRRLREYRICRDCGKQIPNAGTRVRCRAGKGCQAHLPLVPLFPNGKPKGKHGEGA